MAGHDGGPVGGVPITLKIWQNHASRLDIWIFHVSRLSAWIVVMGIGNIFKIDDRYINIDR